MQVENNIQNKSSPIDEENSHPKEEGTVGDFKKSKAENRIAKYEQKPQRKASKMLVRLLQWADKLVIKFFTKNLLPSELLIFFNREARANKVELKKAQIDYSVEDFAVRLYVFWICYNHFQKAVYEENLEKLLLELRDQLSRKKKNLAQSLQICHEQTQKKQKEEELKWMDAIISGLNTFINNYAHLTNQDDALNFLMKVTSNIMIDCLRKPSNKLLKKKEKLKIKIKYFQEKISQILGNPEIKTQTERKQKKNPNLIQKNTIIISPGFYSLDGLARTSSNSSAFHKYQSENSLKGSTEISKKQEFQVRLEYPKKSQNQKKIEYDGQVQISNHSQKISDPQNHILSNQSSQKRINNPSSSKQISDNSDSSDI